VEEEALETRGDALAARSSCVLSSIHPTSGKGSSANFACKEFSKGRLTHNAQTSIMAEKGKKEKHACPW
jgi:hypothetical protein